MFKVYRPKGERVKADQVTLETVEQIADSMFGQTVIEEEVIVAVIIPTLDGVKRVAMNDWIVRTANNSINIMNPVDFEAMYEPARVVGNTP